MKTCEQCSDEWEPSEVQHIVSSGGWCAPSEQLYQICVDPALCPDCSARWTMIMQLGIDPGRNGENLRIPRGSFKFKETE